MGKIILNEIRVYAFHGCMEEEKKIGSDYIVNLEVETDMINPAKTDDIVDAVDYVSLNKIVKEEMSVSSKLLEHVAQRIIDRVLKKFSEVESVVVSVAKQNPPIGGDVGEV
ncbi:MAG: dihydroneopterin aldolase, partial [Crocinitomicaceae bacterium]|nr:dihydroneopterin aldolase [Crocinitomicaceae bacterium]